MSQWLLGGGPWMNVGVCYGLANYGIGDRHKKVFFVRSLINNSDNGYGQTNWTSSYRGMANANLAIEKIPEIEMGTTMSKAPFWGEARFFQGPYY